MQQSVSCVRQSRESVCQWQQRRVSVKEAISPNIITKPTFSSSKRPELRQIEIVFATFSGHYLRLFPNLFSQSQLHSKWQNFCKIQNFEIFIIIWPKRSSFIRNFIPDCSTVRVIPFAILMYHSIMFHYYQKCRCYLPTLHLALP